MNQCFMNKNRFLCISFVLLLLNKIGLIPTMFAGSSGTNKNDYNNNGNYEQINNNLF